MKLSLNKLSQRLLSDDPRFNLVRYINKRQGFSLGKIDYNDAAAELGISARTVGRIVQRLAAAKILFVYKDKLQINEELALTI